MTSGPRQLLPQLGDRLAQVVELSSREPRYAEPHHPLPGWLGDRLASQRIHQLFTHQTEAWDATRRGENVAVVTGTSSGKSLCYHLPTLVACREEPLARALYLFPTKALAQDQLARFESLAEGLGIYAATFDGDSPKARRAAARREAHVILSNPDMLHIGILPNHESWARFLRSLRVIVIDEMHVYRGVFGSHVAGVLRRLLRLCEWHRAKPLIVACSATVANPAEHFFDLTGQSATLVDNDGSGQGRRTIAILAPPKLEDPQAPSPNRETATLLADFSANGARTLAFCRSRISAELVLRYARERLTEAGDSPAIVESYRGGYTPAERRKIERDLFSGKLLGLATTNAMELGVDIGGLDAVIVNGYPGTASSFWQQVGRAGRSGQDGLGLLITHADPVEAFIAREPDLLLSRRIEHASVRLANPSILRDHLACAAHERAVTLDEAEAFAPNGPEILNQMVDEGLVQESLDRFYYKAHVSPASRIDIRGTSGPQYRLDCGERELGTMEEWRAFRSVHPGAVYLHRGETFVSTNLDLGERRAELAATTPDYYTVAVGQSLVEPGVILRSHDLAGWKAELMSVKVTSLASSYRKLRLDNGSMLEELPLDLPAREIDTIGIRFSSAVSLEDDPEFIASVHTAEHALTSVAPIISGGDRRDHGSAWYGFNFETAGPCLYVFDVAPGGVGLSESLMDNMTTWLELARDLIVRCPCTDGCPLCILSSACECGNEPLDKRLGVELIATWLATSA